ncbi:MAG: hypothetical protein ACI9WC_001891 [Arenicella sp.]|jgi:hypothetical protein
MKVTLPLSLILLCLISFNSTAQQTCKTDSIVQTAPDSRFTNNGDGTVTDMQTGLMWARCRQGFQGAGCDMESWPATNTFTWAAALALDSATSIIFFAGTTGTDPRTDWRLPNIKELQSLVEISCFNPAINNSVFPNTGNSFFWSASPDADSTDKAWGVSFYFGFVLDSSRNNEQSVRLVRGGQ